MRPVRRDEILGLGEYEQVRPRFRQRMIEAKRQRRVAVGEHISVVFENRETVMLQIQEMLRAERITREPAIAHEIETYNELVPGDDELSFSLFIEIPDKQERERMLEAWAGLEAHVSLEVDGRRYPTVGERQGAEASRTTAVHYLRVPLPESAAAALRAGSAEVAIVVDHPACAERAVVSPATLRQLAEDLAEP